MYEVSKDLTLTKKQTEKSRDLTDTPNFEKSKT